MPPVDPASTAATPEAPAADPVAALKAELEAKLATQTALLEKATATIAALTAERPAETPEPPKPQAPAIAPDLRNQLDGYLKETLAPYLQGLGGQVRSQAIYQQKLELNHLADAKKAPADVLKRAQEIFDEQVQANNPVLPAVALQHAFGDVAMRRHDEELKANTTRQTFNSASAGYPGAAYSHLPSYQAQNAPPPRLVGTVESVNDWLAWGRANDLPL